MFRESQTAIHQRAQYTQSVQIRRKITQKNLYTQARAYFFIIFVEITTHIAKSAAHTIKNSFTYNKTPLHTSHNSITEHLRLNYGGKPKDHPIITQGSPKDGLPKMTKKCLILYIYYVYIYILFVFFICTCHFFFVPLQPILCACTGVCVWRTH